MRDFKPMLSQRPDLRDLVKARALQSLSDHIRQYPALWQDRKLKVRARACCGGGSGGGGEGGRAMRAGGLAYLPPPGGCGSARR